jgi:precorrin-6B methylase 2/mono/diheme cytochrome c family protein
MRASRQWRLLDYRRPGDQETEVNDAGSTGVAKRRSANGPDRENEHPGRCGVRFHDPIRSRSSACVAGRPVEPAARPRSTSVAQFLCGYTVRSVLSIISTVVWTSVAATSAQSTTAGNQAAGKALFRGAGACLTCHTLELRGGGSASDLSWIGMLRSADALRRVLIDSSVHSATLSPVDLDHLVAYLRTLRALPPSEPRERTREIATVSENVEFFNRPERAAEERTDDLIKALEIPEGATVADIGAGTGFFTWRLARQVGSSGTVIAVDLQQAMLDRTAETVKQHELANVRFVRSTERDPKLPPQSVDVVFIAHSYHEFGDPETMMEGVRRSLKPGGRLVIVEYAKEKKLAPASTLHKMSFDEIRSEIEPMGFELDRILDFLPTQHGLIFTVR